MRYGIAVLCALAALVLARMLVPLADAPVYSLLVGAVAVSIWYGGFLPGLVTLCVGWAIGPFLLVASGSEAGFHSRDDVLRWAIPLAVALVIVWISVVMRRAQQFAATAAIAAEESTREMESLQQLATALSAAVTQTDIAHALIERTPALLGARGGSVGLIDGDELVILDAASPIVQTHRSGLRLSLRMRAPIVRAAADDEVIVVRSRPELTERFPDGAARSPFAHAALALPLRVAGEVLGSMSFLYERNTQIEDEVVAVAAIAADLGGQALERALLYERERESRQALDRVLRVAPRFHADTAEHAATAICREARVTFAADLAEIWRADGEAVELMSREPHAETLAPPPAEPLGLDALPGLRNAIEQLEVTFVSDTEALLHGPLLRYARELGARSWLWAPIVIGGHAERALLLSWHDVVSEPDGSTLLLARRFADHAGLALEQIERLEAQAQAARRAERTRRLQRVTAALSQAATPADVSDACLGEPVWALSGETRDRSSSAARPTLATDDQGSIAVPLKIGRKVRGAFQLSFREPHMLSDEDQEWLVALASQCAQAFERSRLFDEEQRLRRRSERLQSLTASLSSSVTQVDVANVVVAEVAAAVEATAGALAVVADDQRQLVRLAQSGYEPDDVAPWLDVRVDAQTPATRALKRRTARLYETRGGIAREFPDAVDGFVRTGHQSFLFVPLAVGGKANGVIVMSWAERATLADEDRSFVQTLANLAAEALERARYFESERTIAETLQRSVLPVSLPEVDGIKLAARYLPGTADVDVGGDWFDVINVPSGRLGLVVGDVVGKGVESAATMAQLRNALRAFALDRMKPSSTLARLNRLVDGVSESAFATVVYVVVDPAARVCRFTSAGHPPPLAIYPDGSAAYLEGGRGLPLGTVAEPKYPQGVVELPVGTTLILYSDGLIERRDKTIDEGLAELRAAALAAPLDPERLVEHVLEELLGSGERRDDVVILAVRLLVAAPETLRLRLPSTTDSLDVVRDAMRAWLEHAPVTPAEAGEIVLAAWEACANAVEHAVDPADDFFSFTAELDELALRISIDDTGTWSPETVGENRGLGLQLMRSLMSSVEIEMGAEGTKVTLERDIAGPATVA